MNDNNSAEIQEDLHVTDYVRPILSHKWLILGIVLVVTVGTYAFYARQSPVYEASTKILIGAVSSPLDGSGATELTNRAVQNQATLLTSRKVVDSVAKRLGRKDASGLSASIKARPSTDSDFVLIAARRPKAKEAADVANAFAKAFIEIRSKEQRKEIAQAIRETRAQLDKLPRGAGNLAQRAELADTLQRLTLTLALPTGSATQVDLAAAPRSPVAPQPLRNALFGFVLSLAASIGLAFGLERFDRSLKRVEDIAPLFNLPILGVLPHSEEVAFRSDNRAALSPIFKESFRQLRTNIQFAEVGGRPLKRILVTSAIGGEGKSTVVRNLAIVFREWGLKVAVVDADLRRPALPGLFDSSFEYGLTDVLRGKQRLQDALVPVPVSTGAVDLVPNADGTPLPAATNVGAAESHLDVISLLPAGPQPANPQAVLAAEGTETLLDEIQNDHDILLIDSPPLLVVSDAVPLTRGVDAVIVVVRLGLSTRDSARSLASFLSRIPDAHPLGVVVNDLTTDSSGYGYGYGYGYGA